VALKVMGPELSAILGGERFHQEIKIAANLTHPHILPLHDSGDAEGFLYYVMPHIEGESLRDKLAHEGELPIGEAVRILRDVVDALSEAHDKGVVHRDIKPENVLLTRHHALVTDFGVAKAVSEATGAHQLTTEGVALGTPAYMSPEQAAADKHIDHRADIYAVGALAYELLTGRPPFTGTTLQEILSAQLTRAPEPVTRYRESVPPALEQLVMKCLEKKPADRWQSAEELLPQLEALFAPSGGVTPTGTMPVDRVAKRRWMMVGGAVGAVAVIAVIVVMAALPRGGGVALDPNHVVVAEFRNATGDPSLDLVGERVGHWITQGIQQAAIPVTPWDQALQSWEYVQTETEAGRVRDPVGALAEETGAGTVVSGAVYLVEGDSLEIQMNVTDAARGRPLGVVEPVRGSRSSVSEIITDTQQRVMAFLAIRYDESYEWAPGAIGEPPTFEAYEAFQAGIREHFTGRMREAIPHYQRAFRLDSSWAQPLLRMSACLWVLSRYAEHDSVVSILEGFGDRLTPFDAAEVQYHRALNDGDREQLLTALHRASELAPHSFATDNLAWALILHFDRPYEAIDVLLRSVPQRRLRITGRMYLNNLMMAYWDTDQHEEALEVARDFREVFGDNVPSLYREAYSLAGLGRVEEVNALVDEILALPEEGLRQGLWIRRIAVYLRRHGHVDAAREVVDRAIQWYEARPPETKSSPAWRYPHYSIALYVAGRCDEAYGVIKPLSAEFPENISYRGFVGEVAACRGDREEALETSQWLEALDTPYLYGANTMWRSVIAAALGDGESAVALWRQARAEGYQLPSPGDSWWVTFESLRDYPPWQELTRPKG
jgi:tetratricopeptide (TPR) repeat protein